MYIYRVVEKNTYLDGNLINESFQGVNTFDYNPEEEYLHFFILPESAEIYQRLKYINQGMESVILRCDVPYSILKDNFGIGMYSWYKLKVRSPFLEARLKKENFNNQMIVDVTNEVKEEWKNQIIYNRYMNRMIDDNSVNRERPIKVTLDKNGVIEKVELKSDFNFLNYFPQGQLKAESLKNDYKEDVLETETYDNVKIESINKSFLDKIKSVFCKKKRKR